MADVTITITKVAGALVFAPNDSIHIGPGDRVQWTSPDGHITILIKGDDDPFSTPQHTFAADIGEATPLRRIRRLKVAERPSRQFDYAVAHLDPADVLVTDDPDLILDDGGGGGGVGAVSGRRAVKKAGAKKAGAKKAGAKKKAARKGRG
jgi:hypothetical protein